MTLPELQPEDLRHVVSSIPDDLRLLVEQRNLIIGGGFIRDLVAGIEPTDIDLFAGSRETLKWAARELSGRRSACRTVETANAITVAAAGRWPVQFINRWTFPDLAEVALSFDFTICQAAVSYHLAHGWQSARAERFYVDLAARRLTYTLPDREEDAGGSLLRAVKFVSRGYRLQAPDLALVVARACSALPSVAELGGERPFAAALLEGLRTVDPLRMVDGIAVAEGDEGGVLL